MPSYVLLLNYTDTGIQNVKYMPLHISAFRQAVETAGGKMPQVYLTMGAFDVVAVIDAPSDEVCLSIVLTLASVGNVRSTTLRAFSEEDIPNVVRGIPSLEDDFTRIMDYIRTEGEAT